ncbi:MAG: hypothetical protein PWP23_2602 [Candidatus Sumerlaeota bacterium]|nr:hypothetical protein [Candidatus Sumerlaeota bacterium]
MATTTAPSASSAAGSLKKLSRSQRALIDAILTKDGSQGSVDSIVTLAEKVAADAETSAALETLRAGVKVSIPIEIGEPKIDEQAINDAKAAHDAELKRVAAANAAVIQGIAITIVGAAALAAGAGTGTAAVVAFLPAAKKILKAILESDNAA